MLGRIEGEVVEDVEGSREKVWDVVVVDVVQCAVVSFPHGSEKLL